MKVIYQGDREHFERAVEILRKEIDRLPRYDRPGWGWTFQSADYPGTTFFVRGLKDGLSIHAKARG